MNNKYSSCLIEYVKYIIRLQCARIKSMSKEIPEIQNFQNKK